MPHQYTAQAFHSYSIYLMSYPGMATTMEDAQTSGTDLEEMNTEDEMATDTSKWSEKECKKLQTYD